MKIETAFPLLKDFFEKEGRVEVAYLFGSQARGTSGPLSDIDIAILLKKEIPAASFLDLQLRFISELGAILKENQIEVVILNQVGPRFIHQVIKHGKIIFEGSKSARVNFETLSQGKYLDHKYWYEQNYKIFTRRILGEA